LLFLHARKLSFGGGGQNRHIFTKPTHTSQGIDLCVRYSEEVNCQVKGYFSLRVIIPVCSREFQCISVTGSPYIYCTVNQFAFQSITLYCIQYN
jgi:hypothetical protein